MNVQSLDNLGYVAVNYPQSLRPHVQKAMESWIRFCDLPLAEKQKLSGGDRIHDYGYMNRNDSGHKADRKELFHLMRKWEPALLRQAERVTDRRAVEFVRTADALIGAMEPLIMDFAKSVEERYAMPGFVSEVHTSSALWTFRFLHYFGGDILANAHADRLGFTLHLDESAGGGEYLGFDRKWKPWPITSDQTIIFPSIGLQHRSGGQMKALWHRVVPIEGTREKGRYAMVAFIDFPQEREWDKVRFPRVQNFPEGFNYDMSFAELDAMFTKAAA